MNGHPELEETFNATSVQVTPSIPGKRRLEETEPKNSDARDDKRRKGTAPIKEQYLVHPEGDDIAPRLDTDAADDDAAEAFHHTDRQPASKNSKRRDKNQGQNTGRKFGSSRDEVGLCSTRTNAPEFSPADCRFGESCKFEHDLRKYLKVHKRADLATFDALCPVWDVKGTCPVGWKCRFVGSHSREVEHVDGGKEMVSRIRSAHWIAYL